MTEIQGKKIKGELWGMAILGFCDYSLAIKEAQRFFQRDGRERVRRLAEITPVDRHDGFRRGEVVIRAGVGDRE